MVDKGAGSYIKNPEYTGYGQYFIKSTWEPVKNPIRYETARSIIQEKSRGNKWCNAELKTRFPISFCYGDESDNEDELEITVDEMNCSGKGDILDQCLDEGVDSSRNDNGNITNNEDGDEIEVENVASMSTSVEENKDGDNAYRKCTGCSSTKRFSILSSTTCMLCGGSSVLNNGNGSIDFDNSKFKNRPHNYSIEQEVNEVSTMRKVFIHILLQ